MKENILQTAQNIHCIGIKGTGLSALAGILQAQGKNVTGSDANGPHHDAKNISQNIDLVIYSAAVPPENIERKTAQAEGIPELSYPEALGILTQNYKTIAICGTHGKTTTTSMVATILKDEIDPTILVGANISILDGHNFYLGKGEYLIIEACEYQRHFLHYYPDIICVTNIELDHVDYFEDENDYEDAFISFFLRLSENGTIVVPKDHEKVMKLIEEVQKKRPDISVVNYSKEDSEFAQIEPVIPGEHNRYNGLAALKTAQTVSNISKEAIQKINNFTGASRRFEQFICTNGQVIIDDYAHHPTAVKATLKAARAKFGPDKSILCVFQPHQHSRTRKLLKGFLGSFNEANEVIIPNIYQTRDSQEDIQSMSAEFFVEELSKHHPNVHYGHGLEKTLYDIQNRQNDFDIIIFMGAGDIITISDQLKSSSR
ncbi:MAG: UDP-N-acetylmuramate--L-alanine ligase [Candidatus Gracilibacteria bacterium]|nr:UDP-N-acetylmuramate--L-alanine ligase [Candidatus Peregrinibacteria bacterium]